MSCMQCGNCINTNNEHECTIAIEKDDNSIFMLSLQGFLCPWYKEEEDSTMTKQKRDVVFTLRLTKEEYMQISIEAEKEGKKPSQLARERILNKEEK